MRFSEVRKLVVSAVSEEETMHGVIYDSCPCLPPGASGVAGLQQL